MSKPHQFQPGRSGNPGGRSKAAANLARLIRTKTNDGVELLDMALGKLRDESLTPSAWVTLWIAVVDRGFGKPFVAADSEADEAARVSAMSDAELLDAIEQERARVRELSDEQLHDELAARHGGAAREVLREFLERGVQ